MLRPNRVMRSAPCVMATDSLVLRHPISRFVYPQDKDRAPYLRIVSVLRPVTGDRRRVEPRGTPKDREGFLDRLRFTRV